MNYTSYNDLSIDIKNNLHLIRDREFDLIVGIPRSGMIPAYMIALGLNVQCTSLPSFLNNEPLSHGITRKTKSKVTNPWDAKNVLLVDDSISTGKSLTLIMESLPDHLKAKVTSSVIYSSKPVREEVNIIFRSKPNPRVFEWNFFHHPFVENACIHMDGIIFVEAPNEVKANEEKYVSYIKNVKANVIPSYKLHTVITDRLEKYRDDTAEWLRRHNINYDHLIMKNVASEEKKQDWMAKYYKDSSAQYFIVKDSTRALKIKKESVKFVFCIDENKFYSPSKLEYLTKDPYYIPYQLKLFFNNLKGK